MSDADDQRQVRQSIENLAGRTAARVLEETRASDRELETAKALGAMGANIMTLMVQQEAMDKKLDNVVAVVNRWKGATALLIIVGGILGYLGNFLMKFAGFTGKA